jgi:cytochrome c2
VFKKCMTCHSKLAETAQNMIGPVLNGLKGRKSGPVPGGGRTNTQPVRESSEERRLGSQDQDDVMQRLLFGILTNA